MLLSQKPRRLAPLLLSVSLFLAGCAAVTPTTSTAPVTCAPCAACPACPGVTPPAPPPAKPLQQGDWSELPGWTADSLAEAWPAFLTSCRTLGKQPAWLQVCEAARALPAAPSAQQVSAFFEARLAPWRVVNPDGTREGLITGYYEPLIKGSRVRTKTAQWPIHGVPDDLLTIEFGDLYPELKGMRLRGRLVGRKVLPYWSRADLVEREDKLPMRALLYANDPLELFFLQVQGSGRVQLPDGSLVRVGYADQNGQPYQSIGRWLIAHGELKQDEASMDGIKSWARTHPQRLSELLNANPSYVFFREMPNASGGPTGAMGLPLTDGRSLAVDPRTIPLGAPVFLATTWPNSEQPLQRLMMAQDTGGAIKGAVRADLFWGFGEQAASLAGRMRQKGSMWILWPRDQAPK